MSPFAFNPFTGSLDVVSDLSGHLKLDQTTPQTVSGGSPVFGGGITTGEITSGTVYDTTQVVVSGAGSSGANGTYTWNSGQGLWVKDSYYILLDGAVATLEFLDDGTYVYYYCSNFTGTSTDTWGTFQGTAPAPTALYPTSSSLKLSSLTTNGFLKTGSSDGTLSVDTTAYAPAADYVPYTGATTDVNLGSHALDTTGEITGEMAKVQTSAPSTQIGDLWLDTDADPEYKFGDASDYTMFDPSTGHQTMVGDAKPYEDLRVEPVARTTGANAPTFRQWFDDSGIGDTGSTRGVYLYEFDNAAGGSEKEVFFTMQMPHAWDSGTIHLHVHWIAESTAADSKVRWGLEYTWAEPNAVFGATATIIYADTPVSTDTGTTAGKHQITEFADITPTTSQDGLSSIMICRLFRDSANGADTYTGDAGLLYIDAHYQLNSLGSDEEYTK